MLALSLLFLATSFIPTARADWMNLTGAETAPNIAEITVLDDRVRIALEVYIGDLATFEALLPDEWLKTDVAARSSLAERLKRFSAETLQVVTGDGTRLQADLKLAEARLRKDRASPFAGMINPMTRRRVPGAPEDKRVLYAELEYPFSGRPGSLTIVPPRNADGEAAVTIGFIAYHKSVPIIDFRYLSGPARVALDWGDPWYTKFDNPNLKRHHKSALMAFLYVEPREVRHEVLIRVRDLQDWTDLGLNGDAVIEYADRARIKERAQAFFATRNPLEVDGVPAMPAATRAEFLNVTLTGLRVIEDDNPLDLSTAILGIILSYPAKHLPQHVSVEWDLFSERVQRIPTTAIDPAGPFLGSVEAADPTFEWRNFLLKYQEPVVSPVVLDDGRAIGVPALSVLLVIFALGATALAVRPALPSRRMWLAACGASALAAVLLVRVAVVDVSNPFAGPPDEEASAQILSGVLANVNHAYLEKDPAALRRALGVVVANDALTDVEAELGRALAIKVAGGGIARVDTIEDMTLVDITTLEGQPGFRSVAEWTAKASAGHWGHAHRRTIRFRALVELVEQDGAWKLAGITVVGAKQLG
jgi:phosphohistidine swiveling domain-containing protein